MNTALREYLFDIDPYEGFDHTKYPLDCKGFNTPASVLDQVAERQPKKIIEAGTWKGYSAFYMAEQLKGDFEMLCVDTWLGAREMWVKEERCYVDRYSGLNLVNGFPNLYYQFLANVVHKGFKDQVTPFPTTSIIAARLLHQIGYQADFIYIDGSHDFEDVLHDLQYFWHVLSPGGMICGDDYSWHSVGEAVRHYVQHHLPAGNSPLETYPDGGWRLLRTH